MWHLAYTLNPVLQFSKLFVQCNFDIFIITNWGFQKSHIHIMMDLNSFLVILMDFDSFISEQLFAGCGYVIVWRVQMTFLDVTSRFVSFCNPRMVFRISIAAAGVDLVKASSR